MRFDLSITSQALAPNRQCNECWSARAVPRGEL
jgi:hypothetical protein